MITLIGTAHVSDIPLRLVEILDETKPDVVCMELDIQRYDMFLFNKNKKEVRCPLCNDVIIVSINTTDKPIMMTCSLCKGKFPPLARQQPGTEKQFFIIALFTKLGKRMASKYKTYGDEMLVAANYARSHQIPLKCIDMDILTVFQIMWNAMSLFEKIKFSFSCVAGLFASKKMIDDVLKKYQDDYDAWIEIVGRVFPTVKKILIDKRNNHMVSKLVSLNEKYQNILVVLGDGHVPGISKLLESKNIDFETIRLQRKEKNDD